MSKSTRPYKYCVIDTNAPSDSDYEVFTDNGVHNTLREYWDWCRETDVDVEFEIRYYDRFESMYEHGMKVMACFENKDDYNDFAVTHIWNTPKNKLIMENDEWIYEKS